MDNLCYVFLCSLFISGAFCSPLIPTNKLSLATWGSYHQKDHKGPGTYAFGYDIEDPVTGNVQFKQEERHSNGTVTGNYGYVDADGKALMVTYISDAMGYRAKVEKEGEPTQYFPDAKTFYGYTTFDRKQVYPSKRRFVIKQSADYFGNNLGVITANGDYNEPEYNQQNNFIHNPSPLIHNLNSYSNPKYDSIRAYSK